MPPYTYDENGRRVVAPTKGELREKQILDEAEKQLADVGPERMTVESIAAAAGLTRGALYFYFRSKNDVLAALVQRITVELDGAVATRQKALPESPGAALSSAIQLTSDLWRRHGAVMRAAVELTPSVPVIEQLWVAARKRIVASLTGIIAAGAAVDPDAQSVAMIAALSGMTERAFYEASRSGADLQETGEVVAIIWGRTFPFLTLA